MNQKVGTFITLLRKENHLTQEQLAEKLGVTNRSVSRWENGYTLPDLSLMKELSQIFNVTLPELLNGGPFPPSASNSEQCTNCKDHFKQTLLLFSQFSEYEFLQRAKKVRFYFGIGLFFHGILLLQMLCLSFHLTQSFAFTPAQMLVLVLLGIFFEIKGFFTNAGCKKFTPQELSLFLLPEDDVHMKTGEEMLQFARRHQKHTLAQHKQAFETIASLLSDDETVRFSMIAEDCLINDSPGPWHLGIAVTDRRLFFCGEAMRGRLFPHYNTDTLPLDSITSVSLSTANVLPEIVLSSPEMTLHLKGEKMNSLIKNLKKALNLS